MTARLSLHYKAEEELYKLDRTVKGLFYDFCHRFRKNPDQPGLDLKKLKGDSRIHRAKINQSYRALLIPVETDERGRQHWLIIAVRHRKDVYDELQVAVNRVTGELEFVDLAVMGDSSLQRAGITLTPAEPDDVAPTPAPIREPDQVPDRPPLLGAYTADQLRDLGVAEQLIDLALAVTTDEELDRLVSGAPLLSKDVLYGLAAGMSIDSVLEEVTRPVKLSTAPDLADISTAVSRTNVSSIDDDVQAALDEGSFRSWKHYLHPTQAKTARREYTGPARVSGGPGTGKTVVALHRVKYLVEQLTDDGVQILLTTFTANLAADLRLRLTSLISEPELLARVDVMHIDQLAARVIGENTDQRNRRKRISDQAAMIEMRQLLLELDEKRWEADFLLDEWEQVILGQALTSRSDYFSARRGGRGRALTRPERSQIWKLIEQFAARLDKLGAETWGQAAERAARFEIERAAAAERYRSSPATADDSSGSRPFVYRYRHVVVDEAQDLRAAHWKMLRAMVEPGPNDLFIAGDTHQRIYDHQVSLGALGINIRGRSRRLTLSYRTTREILEHALRIAEGNKTVYDDLDDGVDNLSGYRSVLHGPTPTFLGYQNWPSELAGVGTLLQGWRDELSTDDDGARQDPSGHVAVAVADHEQLTQVIEYLEKQGGLTCAELTKDGPRGDGEIHVGTMHRFKGLEYQRLAIIGVRKGAIPRPYIERYRRSDPQRYELEQRKARSLLFVAATRARDVLAITWHGAPSPLLDPVVNG
ncbi:DNA helicase [Micromonospora tulbaghiae]|uniref:DNA 3'-5' helicase n=1 Tax=Micromonospora tulbaghiae TaxID=479978 RepID=A0A386WQ45_9ACTN|nr:UvrD-helicase domain-containing protein [Micromonospora tulbaghiae]AYF30487.1 DNA helicase [Micromonospora tulbaghiae]